MDFRGECLYSPSRGYHHSEGGRSLKTMTIKQTLQSYCQETGVMPPFTRRKIEKRGHDVSAWLNTLKEKLQKADDVGNGSASLNGFFAACEKMM